MTASVAIANTGTFTTDNIEHAEFVLGNAAIPYSSELISPREQFSTRISVRSGVATSVSRARTRGRCRVHTAMPANALALVISRVGTLPHVYRGEEVVVCDDAAFIHSPEEEVKVLTPSEQEVFFFRVDQKRITTELEGLLDRAVSAPLKFKPHLSLKSTAGLEVSRGIQELYRAIESSRASGDRNMAAIATWESHILRLLLEHQSHNYTRILNQRSQMAPAQVRSALEYIEANAQASLGLGDIARAAGTNARTLQYGFQKNQGCSPLQYLKRFRLEKVRIALETCDGAKTVTRVAADWGFLHFGRFADEYQKFFGERPSETLRKRKMLAIARVA